MEFIIALAIGVAFAAALFQILQRRVLRAALGLMMLANAVNLFLLATGAYLGEEAAYVGQLAGIHSDALPQALILTAIIISFGGTAFVLAMICIAAVRYKTGDADALRGLKH